MQSLSSNARFLGVDLKAVGQGIRQSWQSTIQKRLFYWLTPSAAVVLLHADGSQSIWLGEKRRPSESKAAKSAFTAVELPSELVLLRTISVPLIRDADIADAIALEAHTSSPFAEHDMAWGYHVRPRKGGVCDVELAIASRKQAAAYLASQSARLPAGTNPEVWVLAPLALPIILGGFGEGSRDAFAKMRRHFAFALLWLAFILGAAIAVTPTAQLRLRAIEAVQAHDDAVQRTATAARQRELLMQSVEKLGALSQTLAGRIEPLRVLDKLTTVLPDDTALQSFKLQGSKVTISGDTANASTLLQTLGGVTGLRDVRAPSAATRMLGAPRESFVIEFTLDPQVFGVVMATPPVTSPPAAVPVDAVVSVPTLPGPTTAPAAIDAARQSAIPASPPVAPVATFGGRATFGGTMPKLPAPPASAASPSNKIKP